MSLPSQLHIHVAWAKESIHATLASTWPKGLQLSLSDSRRLPRRSSRELRQHELRRRGCNHVPASIFYVQRPAPRCRLELRQCRDRGIGCTPVPMHHRPSRVTSLACGHSPAPPNGDSNVQTIGFVFVVGSHMCLCILLEVEQRI